jgi:hypothetical protein
MTCRRAMRRCLAKRGLRGKAQLKVSQGNRIWNSLDRLTGELPGSGRIDSTPWEHQGGEYGRLHSVL